MYNLVDPIVWKCLVLCLTCLEPLNALDAKEKNNTIKKTIHVLKLVCVCVCERDRVRER